LVNISPCGDQSETKKRQGNAVSVFVHLPILPIVGVGGLEPPTSASQTRRAGRLRYTPADKSIIRTMDKRQETIDYLANTAAWLSLFLIILVSLVACQPNPTPSQIEFNPPVNTPIMVATTVAPAVAIPPTPNQTTQAEHSATPTPNNCLQDGGEIRSVNFSSEHLGEDFYFQVYLPPCYHDQPDQRYPVTYLLHGLYYSEDQWPRLGVAEQMDRLVARGEIPPFIVILPREARFHPPQISAFDNALIEELIPWVDQHYRTLAEKPYRAIGGLSRGAAWSVRIGLEQYQHFDSIGAHSLPLFEADGNRLSEWLSGIPQEDLPAFYIDIGRGDPEKATAQDFADQLNDNNVPHMWYLFNGGHTEDYWSAHLEGYLRWYARDW
jgi:enterochelin esterase-like enzyme